MRRRLSVKKQRIEGFIWGIAMLCVMGMLVCIFISINLSIILFNFALMSFGYLYYLSLARSTHCKIVSQVTQRPLDNRENIINIIVKEVGLPREYALQVIKHISMSYGIDAGYLRAFDAIGTRHAAIAKGIVDIPAGLHIEGKDAGLLEDCLFWDLEWDWSKETKRRIADVINCGDLTINTLCLKLYPLYKESRISFPQS